MKSLYTLVLLLVSLPVSAAQPEVLPPPVELKPVVLAGIWEIKAVVDGKETAAICTIKKASHDYYSLRCLDREDGSTLLGLGILEDGKLWVAWSGKTTFFLCSYRVDGNGKLVGLRGTEEVMVLLKEDKEK